MFLSFCSLSWALIFGKAFLPCLLKSMESAEVFLKRPESLLHWTGLQPQCDFSSAPSQLWTPVPKQRARWCLSSASKFLLLLPRHESKSQIQTRAEGQLGRSAKAMATRIGFWYYTNNSNNEKIACAKKLETQYLWLIGYLFSCGTPVYQIPQSHSQARKL